MIFKYFYWRINLFKFAFLMDISSARWETLDSFMQHDVQELCRVVSNTCCVKIKISFIIAPFTLLQNYLRWCCLTVVAGQHGKQDERHMCWGTVVLCIVLNINKDDSSKYQVGADSLWGWRLYDSMICICDHMLQVFEPWLSTFVVSLRPLST